MKTLAALLLILSISTCAYATDFSTINSGSVEAIIKLLPEYKALIKKIGAEYAPDQEIPASQKHFGEIQKLFNKYGVTMEEFPVFMQKVSMGFASLQMRESGMGGMMGGLMAKMGGGEQASDEELDVLENYKDALEKVFGEE